MCLKIVSSDSSSLDTVAGPAIQQTVPNVPTESIELAPSSPLNIVNPRKFLQQQYEDVNAAAIRQNSRRSVSVAFYHSTCLSLNTLLDQGKAPAIDYAPGAWLDYDQTVILGGHPGSFKIAYPGSLRLPGSNEARPVAVKQAVVWSRQRKWELVSPAEQVSNLIREFRTQEFAKVAHAHCLTVLARLQSIDPVKYRAALLPATLPRFADCWLAKTPAGNCFLVEELIPIWAGKFLNNNGKAKEPQTHEHRVILNFCQVSQHLLYKLTDGQFFLSDYQGGLDMFTDCQVMTSSNSDGNTPFGEGNLSSVVGDFEKIHTCGLSCDIIIPLLSTALDKYPRSGTDSVGSAAATDFHGIDSELASERPPLISGTVTSHSRNECDSNSTARRTTDEQVESDGRLEAAGDSLDMSAFPVPVDKSLQGLEKWGVRDGQGGRGHRTRRSRQLS